MRIVPNWQALTALALIAAALAAAAAQVPVVNPLLSPPVRPRPSNVPFFTEGASFRRRR